MARREAHLYAVARAYRRARVVRCFPARTARFVSGRDGPEVAPVEKAEVRHMGRDTTRKVPSVGLAPAMPDAPRITVERLDHHHHLVQVGLHDHPYLELVYFEWGGGRHRVGSREWEVSAGDLSLVAPSETHDASRLEDAGSWVVGFSAEAVGLGDDATAFLSWRTNPLLYPFVRPSGGKIVASPSTKRSVPNGPGASGRWTANCARGVPATRRRYERTSP